MITVAIIIPFYQTDTGILRRALESVLAQRLPLSVAVEVVVVDDGSPVSADSEARGLTFPAPFTLTIITQRNGGVAKARNTGLEHVTEHTTYIAFLDSDDIWHAGHLGQGIDALELGNDFYFCDQGRDGHHHSHFATCSTLDSFHIKLHPGNTNRLVNLTRAEAISAILKDFVSQASTAIFRRSIAPDLFFDVTLRNAGEDMIYFLELAVRATQVCFSARLMVTCGEGVNIYFNNLSWDADGLLRRLVDLMASHIWIQSAMELSNENKAWNHSYVGKLRRDFAFHSLRRFVKAKGKWPDEVHSLAKEDKDFRWWFTVSALQVMIGRPLRLYTPR